MLRCTKWRLADIYLPPVSNGYRALSSTKGPGCCGSLAVQPRDAHLPSSTGIAEGQLSVGALKFVMGQTILSFFILYLLENKQTESSSKNCRNRSSSDRRLV